MQYYILKNLSGDILGVVVQQDRDSDVNPQEIIDNFHDSESDPYGILEELEKHGLTVKPVKDELYLK